MPNSSLFLYTDGITEAENSEKKFYGEERLQRVLQQHSVSPERLIEAVVSDIKKYAENTPQSDDVTMLVFQYRGQEQDSLTIDADIKELGNVLDFIEQDMRQKKIPQNIAAKVIVAAEELFSNIALYAYEDGGEVQIKTALYKDIYTLKFIDKGRAYNPLGNQDPDVSHPLSERTAGGLGIFIAKNMIDFLTYSRENGKNILKIKIKIKS